TQGGFPLAGRATCDQTSGRSVDARVPKLPFAAPAPVSRAVCDSVPSRPQLGPQPGARPCSTVRDGALVPCVTSLNTLSAAESSNPFSRSVLRRSGGLRSDAGPSFP